MEIYIIDPDVIDKLIPLHDVVDPCFGLARPNILYSFGRIVLGLAVR